MADTLRGDWPDSTCTDCGKKGVVFRHWGPLAPVGMLVTNCAECWRERVAYYEKNGTPKPLALHEFFAVTAGPESQSIYRVADKQSADRRLVVEKIALKGEGSAFVGTELKGGYRVGISRAGLHLYREDGAPFGEDPNRRQQLDDLNPVYWGGGTSSIVALFISKEAAEKCLEAENLQPCDERWHQETIGVLKAIGETHHTFIISTGKLRLPLKW